MTEILNYINRLKNSGLGKQKALDFLETFITLNGTDDCDHNCDDCEQRCAPWQEGYNTAKNRFQIDPLHGGGNAMIIDYIPAKECTNKDAWYTCLKCGECGRVFESGIMVDDGGTTVGEEE